MKRKVDLIIITICVFLLSACNAGALSSPQSNPREDASLGVHSGEVPPKGSPSPTFWIPTLKVNPTGTPTISLAYTATPTVSPTCTPTSSPTPGTPHPLTIEYLHQGIYLGSDIVIEETLEPGLKYHRYIASYLSEGLKIQALLTVPFGEKPNSGWPVIIFNHGYIQPEMYQPTERYMDHVHDLAMHGYIIFRPDYRGHASSEGIAQGAYGVPDYTIDVLNALASMQRYPDADPDRIGMWGHSMGGYITLRCMVVSGNIKAAVIWAGVVASYPDLLSRWIRPAYTATPPAPARPRSWWSILIEGYGSPEDNPDFWDSISANSYLTDLSGAVQLHHGMDDQSVPLEFSTILAEQIRNAGGSVEYYQYRGDDHNISAKYSEAMFRTIQFFDRHIKPGTID